MSRSCAVSFLPLSYLPWQSLWGVESLISHAATMTHAGMAAEARIAAGITDSLLRISVGIEDSEDLIADLDHAFQLAVTR